MPAKSKRGSQGSGESTHRAVVLEEERGGVTSSNDPAVSKRPTNALWGLFSFEAAIREAETELVVIPTTIDGPVGTARELEKTGTELVKIMQEQLVALTAGKKKPALTHKERREGYSRIMKTPSVASDPTTGYEAIDKLSRATKQTAEWMLTLAWPSEDPDGDKGEINREKNMIARQVRQIRPIIDDLNAKKSTALEETAHILAYLLHDHQQAVARAYPRAVVAAGFLQPSPVEAATKRLKDAIESGELRRQNPDTALVESLLKRIREIYPLVGDSPTPATANDWVKESAMVGLDAVWANNKLQVSGRAPAPLGVEGMGSHTTAWALEFLALQALLAPPAMTGTDPVEAIRDAVRADLEGEVIEIDYLLPIDQLASGQLHTLFDAALETLDAEDVPAAAVAYLKFRNLLPYATVDAGDRGGHAERVSGPQVTKKRSSAA